MTDFDINIPPNERFNDQSNIICFQTNKKIYFPGETIIGNIFINTSQEIQCKEIEISLIIFDGWASNSKRKESHNFEEKQFYSMKLDLSEYSETNSKENFIIQPGNYKFPFNFQIPKNTEPSFEFEHVKIVVFRRYTFQVKIISLENNKKKAASRVIQIASPFKEIHTVFKKKEDNKNIKYFFLNRGECRVLISAEETCVKYGETLDVICKVNAEQCTQPVTLLIFELQRSIKLLGDTITSSKGYSEIVTTLKKKKIDVNIFNTSQEFKESFQIKDDDLSVFNYTQGFIEHYFFLDDFEQMIISTSSKKFICEYSISVKALCGNDGPVAKIIVYVTNQNKSERSELPREGSTIYISPNIFSSRKMQEQPNQDIQPNKEQTLNKMHIIDQEDEFSPGKALRSLKIDNQQDEQKTMTSSLLKNQPSQVKLTQEELDELEDFDNNCFS